MNALDVLKEKSPLDLTMLEFVIVDAESREASGNAEQAAEELAALRKRLEQAERIIEPLGDEDVILMYSDFGNNQTIDRFGEVIKVKYLRAAAEWMKGQTK